MSPGTHDDSAKDVGGDASDAHVRALEERLRALPSSAPTGPPGVPPDLGLAVVREQLESRIAEAAGTWDAATLIEACDLLQDVDVAQRDREARLVRQRVADLRRIQDAVRELGELDTAEAIERAPEALCESCSFGRGMISAVVGSMWLPRRLHLQDGADEYAGRFSDFVRSARIPLAHTLLEAELVRRRLPALVSDPLEDERTFKAIVLASGSSSYVVAPIMSRGRAVGFLHGDRRDGSERLTDVDRDRIASFAAAFGLIHEQSILRARLKAQRVRTRAAFERAEALLAELETSEVRLTDTLAVAEDDAAAPVRRDSGSITALRVHELLTVREREVLQLMTEGATNTRIAEQLVIAEGTVKSHVKNILRKLRTPTRSAAVARYAHLTRRVSEVA